MADILETSLSALRAGDVQQQDETFVKPNIYQTPPIEQTGTPMRRAPVPEHIREQLRPPVNSTTGRSLAFSQSQPRPLIPQTFLYLTETPGKYEAPQQEIQRYQMMLKHQNLACNLPSTGDVAKKLDDLTRKVYQEYNRPRHPGMQYAHRRVHMAEYGQPPPTIPPPPPEITIDSDLRPLSTQHIPRPLSIQPPSQAHQLAPLAAGGQQSQYATSPAGKKDPQPQQQVRRQRVRHAHQQGRQRGSRSSHRTDQSWVPGTMQDAQRGTYCINPSTGLNVYGAPMSYMPANVVDKYSAWDEGGSMRWVWPARTG